MLRLAKLLITLPVLMLPLWGAGTGAHAQAAMTQIDALRQLAKSQAADGKCRILGASEAEELSGYLARAELAAASRQSLGEVRSAITLGKALGGTAACSGDTADEVKATLAAARQVMAATKNEPDEENAVQEKAAPGRRFLTPQPRNASLADYGRQAFAYYVERRCEYLSHRDVRVFWAAVVREHRAALSAFGRSAVLRTLKRAEADAEKTECGAKSRQIVRAEYTRIAGY